MPKQAEGNFDVDSFSQNIAHPKPGKPVKNNPRTKRPVKTNNIEEPPDRACVFCMIETGTEYYHHSESTRVKMMFGGGIMGGKIKHKLTGWLCDKCGYRFDTKPNDDAPRSEVDDFDWYNVECIFKTWNTEE